MGIVRGTHLAGNSAPKCGLCDESKLSITVGLDLRRGVDSPWKDLRRRSTSSLNLTGSKKERALAWPD